MAQNKSELFQDDIVRLAEFAKALSHPARIAILKVLVERNACICGDIVEALPLAQSTVSQHLKELKSVGLIKGDIDGAKVCYCLNTEVFSQFVGMMNNFVTNIQSTSAHGASCDSTCC